MAPAFILSIYPEHAKEHAHNCHRKNAILVVGNVDASFDEEKSEGDYRWRPKILVKVDVFFIYVMCVRRSYIIVTIAISSSDIVEIRCVTYRCCRDCKVIVHLVRDPGIDCREGCVDGNEVNEADHISPIVFVLKRAVDEVVGRHCKKNQHKVIYAQIWINISCGEQKVTYVSR